MEKVDILVLVLAGDTKLSNRNLKAQQSTWMKSQNNLKILTYSGSNFLDYDGSHLTVISDDGYSELSYKTLKSFEWVDKNIDFNFLFRTNTSSYVDIEKLIKFCKTSNDSYLYRGKKITNFFNDEEIAYVSGAEILLSKNAFKLLLEKKDEWDTKLVDDVSIGKIFQDYKVPIKESSSIIFDNSFFKLKTFNNEYHFRCRVDSPYYFPRFIEKYLIKYIHLELNKKNINSLKRLIYFSCFNLSRIFAFNKHYDLLTYYLFKLAKKLFKK